MNEMERLVAFMKIQYHNLTTLHRHLTDDPAWFEDHEQLGEWYGEVSEQLDYLAETSLALGYQEPGIKDAVLTFFRRTAGHSAQGPRGKFPHGHGDYAVYGWHDAGGGNPSSRPA